MSIDAVDSNSNMTVPKESVPQDGMKREVLGGSLGPITGRIKRIINRSEVLSLGYVLDKHWKAEQPLTSDSFITEALKLKEGDQGHIAEMKIQESVYQTYMLDYQARLVASVGNQAEQDKLNALWAMNQRAYQLSRQAFETGNSEIHLGGVPEYWLPDWVKSFK